MMNTRVSKRVVSRFMQALKFVPKETKQSKVEKLIKIIRDKTGLSKGVSESIADIIVRGRNLEALALQKDLPVEGGIIKGPKGELDIKTISP